MSWKTECKCNDENEVMCTNEATQVWVLGRGRTIMVCQFHYDMLRGRREADA